MLVRLSESLNVFNYFETYEMHLNQSLICTFWHETRTIDTTLTSFLWPFIACVVYELVFYLLFEYIEISTIFSTE